MARRPADQVPSSWAPFPVQDWTAYRRTPAWQQYEAAWGRPGSSLRPDPNPGPGPRTPLVTVAVLVLTVVLLAGALALADRGPDQLRSPWLPADGAARSVQLTGPAPGPGTVEDGRASWAEVAQSLTIDIGETLLDRSSADRGELWRQTINPGDPEQPQLFSVYSAGDGIALELEAGTGLTVQAYRPGLPLLPAGVAAGQRWTAAGEWSSAWDEPALPYRADLNADAADGCLRVSATVVTGQPGGGERSEAMTWRFCPGQGVVERTRAYGTGFAPAALVPPPGYGQTGMPTGKLPPTGAPVAVPVQAPTARGLDLVPGTPRSVVAPVAVTVNQIVLANQSMRDLLVFGVVGAGDRLGLTLQRRLHAGGIVQTATSVQGTILATTSTRTLAAWSPTGVRLWTARTDEVVMQRPVAIDPTTVLTVTVTGRITAWDVPTGRQRWTAESGSGVATTPGTGAGVVVVADTAGALVGYDVATGAVRWSVAGDPAEQLAVVGADVVVAAGGLVYAYDLTDGRPRWTNRSGGVAWAVQSDGTGGVLVTGPRTTSDLASADGVRQWRAGHSCSQTTVTASWTVCWTEQGAAVLDRTTGAVGDGLDLPEAPGDPVPLLLQGRLWLFDSIAWSAWAWTVS